MSDDSLNQRRADRDEGDQEALDAQRDRDQYPRKRPERRRFHFDRSICLGDMVGVLTLLIAVLGGVWFSAQQSAKIDEVQGHVSAMQNTVVTLQTDVSSIRAEVHDLHDWVKK